MLVDSYNLFLKEAQRLPGFKLGTKDDCNDIRQLADKYVMYEKASDKDMMSSCLSALMIRYWYMIPLLYEQSKSLRVEIDDVVNMLYDAFLKAFKYKSWLDSTKAVSTEVDGVEKCINQCITSVRQAAFQHSNTDSRKLNYMTFSIEESVEIFGDSSECLYTEDKDEYAGVRELVECKLKSNDVLSALVIDGVCFSGCFSKKGFNMARLVSSLKKEGYISLFKCRYGINNKVSNKIDSLTKNDRKSLSKLVKQALTDLKQDKEIIYNAFGCC